LGRPTDPLSELIIGACIEVHRCLGPGLLESMYEECLVRELTLRGVNTRRQIPVPIIYKGMELEASFRLDVVVEERIVVEVKAVERMLPVHVAQVMTYLRLTPFSVGLLVNFNVPQLIQGLRRVTRHPNLSPTSHLLLKGSSTEITTDGYEYE